MRRAIILVIDALGVGAMPDAADFGDAPGANTLANTISANGGLKLPNLRRMGLGLIEGALGVGASENPIASYGRMAETSIGKDTTTGHWELAGLVLDQPFDVYPEGFPPELIGAFLEATGSGGVLANAPYSGTAVIEEFDAEHRRTGFPIVYTSADSVFQIAANKEVLPLETLYQWCAATRALLDKSAETHNISRVIARPYSEVDGKLQRDAAGRHDYAVHPPRPTVLDHAMAAGCRVTAIGKIVDIFLGAGITDSVHTGGNSEGLARTLEAIKGAIPEEAFEHPNPTPENPVGEIIFINLVDTDSLYGHRRDPQGYGAALEEIDRRLPAILDALTAEDLLLITGDHGCDPTARGTDHTREYVPLLAYSPGGGVRDLGTSKSFTLVASMVAEHLSLSATLEHFK